MISGKKHGGIWVDINSYLLNPKHALHILQSFHGRAGVGSFPARANGAAARLLLPKGNIALRKQISHIFSDTLVNGGNEDKMVPSSHRPLYKKDPVGSLSSWLLTMAASRLIFTVRNNSLP